MRTPRKSQVPRATVPLPDAGNVTEIRLIDTPARLAILIAHLRRTFTVVSESEKVRSRTAGKFRVYVTVVVPDE